MSAKGRKRDGEVVSRDTQDTPAWVVHRLLDFVAPLLPRQLTWLEPCAGRGALIEAVETYDPLLVSKWISFELRPECKSALWNLKLGEVRRHRQAPVAKHHSITIGDFFTDESWARVQKAEPAVCIQNPPFGLALDFATWALAACKYNFSILRLNWLETPERHDFFVKTRPALGVFSDRPSFDGFGTDATAYAWFCWGLGPEYDGTWRLLDLTSKEIKREANRESRKRAGASQGVSQKEAARSHVARDKVVADGAQG